MMVVVGYGGLTFNPDPHSLLGVLRWEGFVVDEVSRFLICLLILPVHKNEIKMHRSESGR